MNLSLPTRDLKRGRIAAAAVAVVVAGATLIGSAPTYAAAVAPTDSASATGLSITVHPDQLGKQLHPGFVGLSFGAATVAQDNYASTDLGGYLHTLGRTGVIRDLHSLRRRMVRVCEKNDCANRRTTSMGSLILNE